MNKVVSIIIPTYNMEGYLHQCLDSLILNETALFEKTEVLIINDGSKDKSLEIACDYEMRFPKVFRVIDKPNGNYGSCVNIGLIEASGKYIKVLDADDAFYSEAYQEYVTCLSTLDVDLVITDYNRVDSNYHVLKKTQFGLPHTEPFSIKSLNPKKGLEMHAITYKRQILIDMSYQQDEGISYTDAEWSFIPLSMIHSVSYLPIILYRYLIGREGQTVDPRIRIRSLWMMNIVFERLLTYYNDNLNILEEAGDIMFAKLVSMSSYIYRLSIPSHDEAIIKSLEKFDAYIKSTSSVLYQVLEKKILDKHLPVYYIYDWRVNPKKKRNYWYLYSVIAKGKVYCSKIRSILTRIK